MFGDVNKVTLLGNATKDPELRFTPSGTPVLNFPLATNRRFKKGEEWAEEVTYHNITVWNNAEELGKRIKKGTRMYIEGRLSTRSWDGQDGRKNYRTEIVVDRIILISRYEGEAEVSNLVAEDKIEETSVQNSSESVLSNDNDIDPNDLPF